MTFNFIKPLCHPCVSKKHTELNIFGKMHPFCLKSFGCMYSVSCQSWHFDFWLPPLPHLQEFYQRSTILRPCVSYEFTKGQNLSTVESGSNLHFVEVNWAQTYLHNGLWAFLFLSEGFVICKPVHLYASTLAWLLCYKYSTEGGTEDANEMHDGSEGRRCGILSTNVETVPFCDF